MRVSSTLRKTRTAVGLVTLAFAGLLMYSCEKNQNDVSTSSSASVPADMVSRDAGGNGAPNGPHYDLNLIGVPHGKTADMTGNNGHRIFMKLDGNTKINLKEGDFQVLDANGTDGVAAFQLPNPDPDNTGSTAYSVYVRALGAPGGSAIIHTCGTDASGNTYCSGDSVLLVRSTGQSSFTNVSKELLYIYTDVDGDGKVDRIPLFDSRLKDYFWSYDNYGLKLVQMRFYQVSTIVP